MLSVLTPKTLHYSDNVKHMIMPVIPFEHLPQHELTKDGFLTFKLCTNPVQDTSLTYDLTVPLFNHGMAEELFDLVCNMQWVCQGQNVTDGPNK